MARLLQNTCHPTTLFMAMLRVLIIDEARTRAADICAGLVLAGHQVAAVLPSALDLVEQVEAIKPDVILIETESPSRDTLEHLSLIGRDLPRPVVVFARDSDSAAIRRAMRAGVAAYVVDGLAPERIKSVIEVAIARFEEYQALRRERDEAAKKLADRVVIERAKGLLMKTRGMAEDDAFHTLRRLAMERGQKLATVAREVVDVAKVLL
jgi:response regulator NasT